MKDILQELQTAVDEAIRSAHPTQAEMLVFRQRLLGVLDQLDAVLPADPVAAPVLRLRRQLVEALKQDQSAQDAALHGYQFEATPHKLLIFRPDGRPFVYDPEDEQDQVVQKILFEEKIRLIKELQQAHTLSPADRLRLRIELLLSAYFPPAEEMPFLSSEVCYAHTEEVRSEYRQESVRVLVTGPVF